MKNTENKNLEIPQSQTECNVVLADSKKLYVGMVLVPKKDKKHLFKENARYIVTQNDVDRKGDIGDSWEIEK